MMVIGLDQRQTFIEIWPMIGSVGSTMIQRLPLSQGWGASFTSGMIVTLIKRIKHQSVNGRVDLGQSIVADILHPTAKHDHNSVSLAQRHQHQRRILILL